MSSRLVFFASCAPGLEPVLHSEARELKLSRVERQVGGIYFEGTMHDAWRANMWLRTAVRVFMRVARFHANDANQLYKGALDVDWSRFVSPEGTLVVDSQSRDSELFHTHFIQQRVKDAVVDQFRRSSGVRPTVDVDNPDLRIHAHLYNDRVTLSVDTSGGSLHKRGWRKYQGIAPIAETLAAALVLMSDWDRRSPFIDPFCGSGTLPIEAAMIAANVAPGSWRKFGFENWPGHDAAAFERYRVQELNRRAWPKKLQVRGSDLSAKQVAGARENGESAGFEEQLQWDTLDALEFEAKPGWNAWIVTNPPYGLRVGDEEELEPLYRDFGQRLFESCEGYQLAMILGNPKLRRALGLPDGDRKPVQNGTIPCEFFRIQLGS